MISAESVRNLVIEELASVRDVERPVIEELVRIGGDDLEIDSKEGQCVAVKLEARLSMPGMIRPEDQTRSNLTTITSLVRLIHERATAGSRQAV